MSESDDVPGTSDADICRIALDAAVEKGLERCSGEDGPTAVAEAIEAADIDADAVVAALGGDDEDDTAGNESGATTGEASSPETGTDSEPADAVEGGPEPDVGAEPAEADETGDGGDEPLDGEELTEAVAGAGEDAGEGASTSDEDPGDE